MNYNEDRIDYQRVLQELHMTEESAQKMINYKEDMISIPIDNYKIRILPSKIQGLGLITTDIIELNEIIGPVFINGLRTQFERYVNHSKNPSSTFIKIDNNYFLKSICKMYIGDEVTVDYLACLRNYQNYT